MLVYDAVEQRVAWATLFVARRARRPAAARLSPATRLARSWLETSLEHGDAEGTPCARRPKPGAAVLTKQDFKRAGLPTVHTSPENGLTAKHDSRTLRRTFASLLDEVGVDEAKIRPMPADAVHRRARHASKWLIPEGWTACPRRAVRSRIRRAAAVPTAGYRRRSRRCGIRSRSG